MRTRLLPVKSSQSELSREIPFAEPTAPTVQVPIHSGDIDVTGAHEAEVEVPRVAEAEAPRPPRGGGDLCLVVPQRGVDQQEVARCRLHPQPLRAGGEAAPGRPITGLVRSQVPHLARAEASRLENSRSVRAAVLGF
eukprot:1185651-Prorocentrum_minimum.AAC.1